MIVIRSLPVEDRIDNGTYIVGNAANVVQEAVDKLLLWGGFGHVNGHKAL